MHSKLYDVPPLDPLLAFEAAARNLSFTRAGEELFITQSAVSRQVQQLEAHLGVKLFERRTRALLLTQPGQIFYRAAKASLEILHDSAGICVTVAYSAAHQLHFPASGRRCAHLRGE
jgi:LysR family transcriptional regulator, glycine cleavage system transcriptional activator